MHQANLTLSGMYNYDNTLFDELRLPEDLGRETVIGNILMACYGLEVIYPDFDTMKKAIGYWSAKMLPSWSRALKALSIQYDPLYNYDRTEVWSENEKSNGSDTGTVDNLRTSYASNPLRQTDQANSRGSSEAALEREHKARMYGNIGVTTSQQMLEAEVQVARINITDIICKDFKTEFCLLVY